MKTVLLEAYEYLEAAQLLAEQKLVVIPTETVYGVGANAVSNDACTQIFYAKNRPKDNPLIVHCSDIEMVLRCIDSAKLSSKKALAILSALAPAPVTIIVHASSFVCTSARAGGETVAIRIPDHRCCLDIISSLGNPIAAPSANMSGMPSATNALMAWETMHGKVSAVVDGGSCRLGLESTIIDCTGHNDTMPRIVRLGTMTLEEITATTNIEMHGIEPCKTSDITVPGNKYKHYAPQCKVVSIDHWEQLEILYKQHTSAQLNKLLGLCVVHSSAISCVDYIPFVFYRHFTHYNELAQNLYELFAEADRRTLDILYIYCPQLAQHRALSDRIMRAQNLH